MKAYKLGQHRRLLLIGAVGLALLLGATQADAAGEVRLVQLLSPRLARQFLETVEWHRYGATQINIAEEPAWEDPAIYFDLKGDAWTVSFPNDNFLSLSRFFLGDIADPRPVGGDIRHAALDLLERNLSPRLPRPPRGLGGSGCGDRFDSVRHSGIHPGLHGHDQAR